MLSLRELRSGRLGTVSWYWYKLSGGNVLQGACASGKSGATRSCAALRDRRTSNLQMPKLARQYDVTCETARNMHLKIPSRTLSNAGRYGNILLLGVGNNESICFRQWLSGDVRLGSE